MDRVDFYKRIEGRRLHITKNGLHIETEDPVRISLDGAIQWKGNYWLPNWDTVTNIEENDDLGTQIFAFEENGEAVIVTVCEY